MFGSYEIQEKLHESSRTLVYRALRADRQPVIIKAIRSEHVTVVDLARFRREYELAQGLRGEGIVLPHCLERFNNTIAIVMEDFGACSLARFLGSRRLAPKAFLELALQISSALANVHHQDVIHKDINPSNIVVHPESKLVKLIDFGISTTFPRENPVVCSPDVIEGTLPYISPEQTGRLNCSIDLRTDLYSLGVTFYEMLTGQHPFRSVDPVEIIHAHLAMEPSSPHQLVADVPEALSYIVMRLLSKSPDDRYQSALGLRTDLSACLERLRATGSLDDIRPTRFHVSERFQIPQKLYGRDSEVKTLLSTFERVHCGRMELLLVSGYSGVGKSALVGELQRPVIRQQGYFAAGKFDQFHRDIPYAALLQALREFIRQILTENEGRFRWWQDRLREAVAESGQVILEVLPELERLIGPQPAVSALPLAEAQNRYNFVFRRFIRSLASLEHPLVLFLDDLQWADTPSLKLLQSLTTDPESCHLLIIGAYRDNEVTGAHPLSVALGAMRKGGAHVNQLELTPLGRADTEWMVAGALHLGAEHVRPLAALAHEKTGGNPFFLCQFLRSLYEKRLLQRDASGAFCWDLDEICNHGITDNVVELMAGKINTLRSEAQEVLKLAACIGNRFDLCTLAIISECSPSQAAASLWEPLRQGLVLPLGEASKLVDPDSLTWLFGEQLPVLSFRFLHDRVQQAAYLLIASSSRQEVHHRIGRLLVRSTPPEQMEERLFDMVNHLGLGLAYIVDADERLEAVRLNLFAGRKAKRSAAHEPALHYLRTGLSLLPEAAFREHYELTMSLHIETIEAEYMNTRFAQAEALSEVALAGARTALDQARVQEARMLFYTAQMQLEQALGAARAGLALLGVELPASADAARIQTGLAATQSALGGRRASALLGLPESTDPEYLAAMRILTGVTASAYIGKSEILPLVVFEMINLCLRHGNSAHSAYAYALYGLLQSAMLGDAEEANAYGDLAVALLDRFRAESLRPKVYTLMCLFIRFWKTHLRDSYELALEGIRAGMEMCDHEYASHAAIQCCKVLTGSGDPLDAVAEELARYGDMATRFKREHQATCIAIYRQMTDCLLGRAEDPSRLSGTIFDEEVMRPKLLEVKNVAAYCILEITRCQLAYLFGDLNAAVAAAERAEAWDGVRGAMEVVFHNFYQSLALLGLPEGSQDERARRLEKVERNQAQMRRWARSAPMNFAHKHDLVEAERLRVLGRHAEARDYYERAIDGAARHRYVQEEALANELLGCFYLSLGRTRLAEFHLVEAHLGYVRWGAAAKVGALQSRHRGVVWRPSTVPAPTLRREDNKPVTSTLKHGGNIDLAAVMKAAQAISGEIILEQLILRLMNIILANAGAQRGVLLLEREGRLVVEAERTVGEVPVLSQQGAAVVEEPHLPQGIINFVARTQECVVLHDATVNGAFTGEPYVLLHRPKSVLCMPLSHQGRRIALIYMENKLTVGAFTAQRVEVLRLLCAQAVLSIQNSVLYESLQRSNAQLEEYSRTLEQKVADRTVELREKNAELATAFTRLRETQRQLVIQEKLASLGALTAGIAHELKNPLNFVNNFAETSREFIDEMLEGQDSAPQDNAARADRPTLGMLRDNVDRIIEHGQRANRIIEGMLLHSRNAPSARESAELNAVVARSVGLATHGIRARALGTSIQIDAEYDAGVGEVEMATTDVSRVIVNLIDNAVYAVLQKRHAYGSSFSPTITVRTLSLGQSVELRIRDNGSGIPSHIIEKIWNPFFTTKPPGEGTGLGLSLSHDIITLRHEGQIRAESTEGEGTEIIITLPRHSKARRGTTSSA